MASETRTGSMNLVDFFMLGFGSMVGVGWSVAVNGWFASGGGPLTTFFAFLIGTLLMIPIGLCYAELTPAMPVAGAAGRFSFVNSSQGIAIPVDSMTKQIFIDWLQVCRVCFEKCKQYY